MEVIGAAANVIAMVDLAGRVWSVCWKYYKDVKGAETEIDRLMDSITALQNVFQHVQKLAMGSGATKLAASKQLLESTSLELEKEFNEILEVLQPGVKQRAKKKFLRRELKWPFQKEEIEQTLQFLERHKTTLIAAMNCDQM